MSNAIGIVLEYGDLYQANGVRARITQVIEVKKTPDHRVLSDILSDLEEIINDKLEIKERE